MFKQLVTATLFLTGCSSAPGSFSPDERTSFVPRSVSDTAAVSVTVDSLRHEVITEVGPFMLSAADAQSHHAGHMVVPSIDYTWPVDGWVRGFRVRVFDSNGELLPGALHHLHLVNYDRRQLLYPIYERLLAASSETADVELPEKLGVPVRDGQKVGIFLALNRDSAVTRRVYVRLSVIWTSTARTNAPVAIYPTIIDVHDVLRSTYDLDAGRSARSYEFETPIAGRIIAVGGHVHDYGESLRLEEIPREKPLVYIRARKTPAGKVTGVERKFYWWMKRAPRILPGRKYRLVVEYDNVSGAPIPAGAMGQMAFVFVPDDRNEWPKLDLHDNDLQTDILSLRGGNNIPHSGSTH